MPLPVGHTLGGGIVYAALDADGGWGAWRRLVLAVVIANAPDLDMVPGVLMGEPNRFHHGVTHTLAGVVVAALVAALVAAWLRPWPLGPGAGRWKAASGTGLMVASLWGGHVLLDAFSQDFSEPYGVPMLWPLSGRYFNFHGWFPWVDKVDGQGGFMEFVTSLLTAHNLYAVTVEAATLVPLLLIVVAWRRKRSAANTA